MRGVGDAQQEVAQLVADARRPRAASSCSCVAELPALGLEPLGLVGLAVAAERADLLGQRLDPAAQLVALGAQRPLARVELAGAIDLGRVDRPGGPARP